MSKQGDIDRNIEKARERLARDRSLFEVVEQIAEVTKAIKDSGGGSGERRLRLRT